MEAGYKHVETGDLVLSGMNAHLGGIGVTPCDGRMSPVYVVLRPGSAIDVRYLAHHLRHIGVSGGLVVLSRSIRFNSADLSFDKIRSLPVLVPPLGEQRAIADYLDTETARIDALITQKRRLITLLEEQQEALLLREIGDWRCGANRTLRQYGTNVLTGPFGTVLAASEYIDGGIPLVNPTHIKAGRVVPEEGVGVSEQVANRIARHRLSKGDIVMGRKGDVGRSAVITEREDGWVCGSDSIAIRCSAYLEPEFLAAALRIGLYRQQLERTSTGAMVLNVNEGILLGLLLPSATREEQRQSVVGAHRVLDRHASLRSNMSRQLDLLVEHRQALITAAVTGELRVPGVAA
ncbi:hypothetical protein OAG98_01805 [Acidimicrobiales bacterium]|nr:hypothetical protein [Acidimicrobiales bacterium]